MGKSNAILEKWWDSILPDKTYGRVAVLGAMHRPCYLERRSDHMDLYDLQGQGILNWVEPWEINSEWKLNGKYDLIVSTRCPYFAKNKMQFLENIKRHLTDEGEFFLDWGLGDHWRFKNYKVGWKKDGEHEWAYGENNFLWSTFWCKSLVVDDEVQKFENWINPWYENEYLDHIIYREVPVVFENIDFSLAGLQIVKTHTKALWPDVPALYIALFGRKKNVRGGFK
jgi:SAM-dependent methyltransferase